MEDMSKPFTNPELMAAVERMNRENSRASREAVLDLLISTARFLAPVTILPAPNTESGTLDENTQIQFQLLTNQENQPFFPAFTSWEELRKLCGPKNQQTLVVTFLDYAKMVLQDNRAAGFVVDPFGCCLSFDRAMTEHLVARRQSQIISN